MLKRSIRHAFGLAAPLARFARRFRREDGGAVAVWFAVLALPMAVLAFGLIDVNRASVEKRRLQDALDAATLLAARSNYNTTAEIDALGDRALADELAGMTKARLTDSTFTVSGQRIISSAKAQVTPVIANLWLQGDMEVTASAEVARSATNVEVSLVLDVTGSMKGQKIIDLRDAANELVKIVVNDNQTLFYSKVAIVPYAVAVNAGSYAGAARGTFDTNTKAITGASWATGSAKSISGATRGNPVVITSNGHGFANGDGVYITGVKGMTSLNNRAYIVAGRTANTFQLQGVNGGSYSSYSSNGTVQKCQVPDCSPVVTSNGHGYVNGDRVYITGVNGMTDINNRGFVVGNATANTFSLGVVGGGFKAYTSGGSIWCARAGCKYFAFDNAESPSALKAFEISNCVTERTNGDAYTDASPGASPLGRNYASPDNPCLTNTITPLSSNKETLKAQIDALQASGSTGGHLGVAWGWYLVSPNFASLFPTASQPAAYGTSNLIKAVVIMTDGEYNSSYCNGVISADSTNGSGATADHINCNAPNGHSFTQTQTLCTEIKKKGILVYTVGFNVVDDQRARDLVSQCATGPKYVYMPTGGTALKEAFAAIAKDLTRLRLAK
ncbi:TadE/TadG family type IV pilus assembly protein [Caulobacter mirabilis]|uniref:Pilus assembly protein TadG n=1 Tax=Caulobacter mirabilis TaxID=69666 RepID=A0A2D2AT95_9CAUL|nr:TadE/TadG family type IV pilus assembly protein [Caulobacter mirabilis]ATQ41230.1 pilus assembly protein TadG [Caulobacter mirabilis]